MTTMTKERIAQWWSENAEGLQDDVSEHVFAGSNLDQIMDNAACCETFEDFKSNLGDAIDAAQTLFNELKEIKDRVTF